jgi:hypothetical protein
MGKREVVAIQPGSEVLIRALELINGPRQNAYGHPADDYQKVVDIFAGITGKRLTPNEGVLFMVAVKLARLGTNLEAGEIHHDSIVDAAGYLGCFSMIANRQGKGEKNVQHDD